MQKYSNNLVLCFVNGEPHLFNKLLKEYNKLSILPDEAFEIIKKDINFENLSSMPSMTKVWNSLAISLGASGYSYFFSKNDGEISNNSFEVTLIKKITYFCNQKFLCFVDGEPFLYNPWNKKYTKYEIYVEEAIDIIKEHVSLIKTQAPSETEIFNVLSVAIGASGYNRNYSKGKNSLYPNSFKNNVYKEIALYFSETCNNNVLCFVYGEAYTFNKFSKVYTKYNISVNEAMEIIKNNISLSNVRPGINDIMQILAKNIGCIGYRWQFNKKNSIPRKDSFENILLKNITKFLDELYPPEERDELLKKKHEYDNKLRKIKELSTSYSALRAARKKFFKQQKNGRKLF